MDASERRHIVQLAITRPIVWQQKELFDEETGSYFRYEAKVEDYLLRLRINDFPDEPLYSLVANNQVLADFEDDLPNWQFAS